MKVVYSNTPPPKHNSKDMMKGWGEDFAVDVDSLFHFNHFASFTGRIPRQNEQNPRTNIATILATSSSDPTAVIFIATVLSLSRESP
jgi:hypothetical protein